MRYLNVGSGSKGNSTIVYTAHTAILIDCGLSKKRVTDCLKTIGLNLEDLAALLITHRHSDHAGHLDSFNCLKDRTYSGDAFVVDQAYRSTNVIGAFQKISIGDFDITALPTSHDVPDSMGYLIEDRAKNERMMYMTDTGYIPSKDLDCCVDCDFYLLESNYDPETLLRSDRDNRLKMRILGDKGHLSNQQCSHYLSEMVGPHTREVALAHLSEECNTPEMAVDTFKALFKAQFDKVPDLILKTLKQKEPTSGGDTVN